ncbi:hypothetical protein ACFWWA_07815 [Streptomyces goshikiensis]|uniref:hypothetical protein n=1 Tax=Streptomyces goshikiensis TaxID=1942 RepID=UPI0036645036
MDIVQFCGGELSGHLRLVADPWPGGWVRFDRPGAPWQQYIIAERRRGLIIAMHQPHTGPLRPDNRE